MFFLPPTGPSARAFFVFFLWALARGPAMSVLPVSCWSSPPVCADTMDLQHRPTESSTDAVNRRLGSARAWTQVLPRLVGPCCHLFRGAAQQTCTRSSRTGEVVGRLREARVRPPTTSPRHPTFTGVPRVHKQAPPPSEPSIGGVRRAAIQSAVDRGRADYRRDPHGRFAVIPASVPQLVPSEASLA
jgi:hypothetical protein